MLLKLILRNAFRHRLRTALTICGMAVAILAFGLLRTVVGAWYAGVDAASSTRLVTRNAISLTFPMPLAYGEKIRSVEGVTLVSYGSWFGGVYKDPKNFFANFAVEPKTYLALYPEFRLSEEERTAFLKDRKACVVGRKLAVRFGWRLGDSVTLKGTIYPGDWDFVVRGIYRGRDRNTDETQMFLHWQYLNEGVKKRFPGREDQVGFYMVGVTHRDLAAGASLAIDALFKNSYAETLTETERAFQLGFVSMTEAILTAIQFVAMVIVFIILAVVANTMLMSVRERMPEYGTLRALGFGGWFIGEAILGESLLLSGLGGALGVLAIFPAAREFSRLLGAYFPVFEVSETTLLLCGATTLLVGCLGALLPIHRAVSVGITQALARRG